MSNRKSKKSVSALFWLFSGTFECAENDYQKIIFRIDSNKLEIGDINRKIGHFSVRSDKPTHIRRKKSNYPNIPVNKNAD